jgi:hypothetical protein
MRYKPITEGIEYVTSLCLLPFLLLDGFIDVLDAMLKVNDCVVLVMLYMV